MYPGGTIPTFIDSMYCTGNETGWSQCEYSTTFAFVCRRDDDVGVRCYNGKLDDFSRELGGGKCPLKLSFLDYSYLVLYSFIVHPCPPSIL